MIPGLNYRIDELRSALGLVQLAKRPAMNAGRAEAARIYLRELAGCEGLVVPWPDNNPSFQSCYHIFPVLLPPGEDRDHIVTGLAEAGIQTSIHYPSFAGFTAYRDLIKETPETAAEINSRVLTLPIYPAMNSNEVMLVIEALKETLSK